MSAPADQLRDRAWFFWRACLSRVQAAADKAGIHESVLAAATGSHVTGIRRAMRGQERLTLERLYCLCAVLELDAAAVVASAAKEAASLI